MKTLLALLLLIPSLSWGHHDKSFEIDDVFKDYATVHIAIYNKTSENIFHKDYLFLIYEKCNDVNPRIYKPDGDYVTRGYSSGMIKIRDIREEFCKIEPYHE